MPGEDRRAKGKGVLHVRLKECGLAIAKGHPHDVVQRCSAAKEEAMALVS